VELDRVRSDAGLSVLEVEEGDAGDDGGRADSDSGQSRLGSRDPEAAGPSHFDLQRRQTVEAELPVSCSAGTATGGGGAVVSAGRCLQRRPSPFAVRSREPACLAQLSHVGGRR
jgi:hypothetical protein